MKDLERAAEFSACGNYRWWLSRRWRDGASVSFVMLNPSTANDQQDDPTIRKCIAFAKAWGFAAIHIVNLFPWNATKPFDLEDAHREGFDITGGERGKAELVNLKTAPLVVAAWGAFRINRIMVDKFLELTDPKPIWAIGHTRKGHPTHPLYQQLTHGPQASHRCYRQWWTDALK